MSLSEVRNSEIFLAQCALYLLLWLLHDYTATLITAVMVTIIAGILIVALLAELVERSKVPRRYFTVMALSILAPVVVALMYGMIMGFQYKWTELI
ncbi:MAG: hypothetical protein KJP00_07075 [Bacteroidia bacterium]|nr:hypothetical protein [Bacteroidia bacterium]